jgi:hypothetical protein
MRTLWAKAKKEATIAGSSALKAIGIVKDHEDPDFVSHVDALTCLDQSVSSLLRYLESFAADVDHIAKSSHTVCVILKDDSMPETQIREVTAAFIRDNLTEQCIKPLQAFLERSRLLCEVKRKRHRNRELMQHSSGADADRRTEKYLRYQTSFINGVDALASKHSPLLLQVLTYQQYYMKEYATALREGLLQSGVGEGLAHVAFPVPSDE